METMFFIIAWLSVIAVTLGLVVLIGALSFSLYSGVEILYREKRPLLIVMVVALFSVLAYCMGRGTLESVWSHL